MPTQKQFVDQVMSRLPKIPDERDIPMLQLDAAKYFDEGWTVNDTVAYFRCMEEVNPELEEGIALARMHAIIKKYPIH